MPLKQLYSGTEVLKKIPNQVRILSVKGKGGTLATVAWFGSLLILLSRFLGCFQSLRMAELTLGCLPKRCRHQNDHNEDETRGVCGQSDVGHTAGDTGVQWAESLEGWVSAESGVLSWGISSVDFRTSH